MGASDDPHDCTVSVAVPLQISTDIAPQSQSYWQLLSPFVVAWDLPSWGNVRARRRDAHTPMARRPLTNYLRTCPMRWPISQKQLAPLLRFQTCAHLRQYDHDQRLPSPPSATALEIPYVAPAPTPSDGPHPEAQQ